VSIAKLIDTVWDYYRVNKRGDLPWRPAPDANDEIDPYAVLVSELMLQQTQVSRVVPKFTAWMQTYPTMQDLASASLKDVLQLWDGLGYTRRAKYLHDIARQLAGKPFPRTVAELTALKGIGENTAGAILTYSYNQSHIFIETNVRTVLLHHMHQDADDVDDKALHKTMQQVLDALDDGEYREFYWAIMDYGTHLKQSGVRNIARSKHYVKQSVFAGSKRQLRGKVMRIIAHAEGPVYRTEISQKLVDDRLDAVLADLAADGLVQLVDDQVVIT